MGFIMVSSKENGGMWLVNTDDISSVTGLHDGAIIQLKTRNAVLHGSHLIVENSLADIASKIESVGG